MDDVGSVLRFLEGRTASLVLRAGFATLDEPSDLEAATDKELARVSISTSDPPLEIDLSGGPSVSTVEDSDRARQLVLDTAALLAQFQGGKWRGYAEGLKGAFIFFGGISVLFALFTVVPSIVAGTVGTAAFWNGIALAFTPMILVAFLAILNLFTMRNSAEATVYIIPESKSARRTASATRSRDITVGLVSAFAGGLLVWVLGWVSGER